MAVDVDRLRIVHHPDAALRRVAEPVGAVTEEVRAVAAKMVELMHEARGVGLAAPQVGLGWRLFVANPTGEPGGELVCIDPKLSDHAATTEPRDEGCLSLPHVTGEVTRPTGVTLTAMGLDGERFTLRSDGFAARVWQHEFDHLEGVLIIDKMTRVDRMANRRALAELEDRR